MKPKPQILAPMFFVLTWMMTCGAEPVVSNVRAAQRAGTKLVDVYYDLSGSDGPATVAVAVSSDGGSTYAVPATSFSGDVGGGVANGGNKHVVWNAADDWNGQFSQAVKFRVTANNVPEGFALIPAGSFTMGWGVPADQDPDARPVSVYVGAFYIAKYEITKALWNDVRTWAVGNGYTDMPVSSTNSLNQPETHSWFDVVKWCNARSQKDGMIPCYTLSGTIYKTGINNTVDCDWSANGYRLPTEAEWEKAARGGVSGKRFPWGDTISHSQANYYSDARWFFDISPTRGYHPSYSFPGVQTAPVGSFTANGYGLYDVVGNVGEWCWDWYADNYYTDGAIDPRGAASGSLRVNRGGSWDFFPFASLSCRLSYRYRLSPGYSDGASTGFRPARRAIP